MATSLPPLPPPTEFIGGTPTSGVPANIPPEEGYWARSKIAGTKKDFYVPGAGPTKSDQNARTTPPRPTNNQSQAVRLTETTDPRSTKYIPPKVTEKPRSILHNFRSFTYNFTLAAIPHSQISQSFSSVDELTNVVLSSKGKGKPTDPVPIPPTETAGPIRYSSEKTRSIQSVEESLRANLKKEGKSEEEISRALQPYVAERIKFEAEAAVNASATAKPAIDPNLMKDARLAYNNSSAGRFDMFIDDVEISTVMGHNSISGTANAFGFTFTVVEPYSIFGFMDALLKSAKDSGYESYIDCVYVLALDFSGYPDQGDLPNPIDIPGTRRFFPIRLYEVNTAMTERGAIYTCKAVPASDAAFSVSKGTMKYETEIVGNTVKEQLTQLMQHLNNLSQNEASRQRSAVYNKYQIEFPLVDGSGEDTRLANAKVESTSVFRSEKAIQTAIDEIITKSEYAKNAVIPGGKGVDTKTAMAKTWKVTSKVDFDSSNERDPNTLSRASIITYKVIEYKTVAAGAVPGHAASPSDYNVLADLSLRRYDYLFTGKNTDILDFKVNFNLAFFAGVTPGMGATDGKDRQSSGNDNSSNPATNPGATPTSTKNAAVPSQATAESAQSRPNSRISPDAWQQMTYQMYRNMISSSTSLFQGEITILGDPYFLIGGDGKTAGVEQGKVAEDGSASAAAGDVLIMLNFYNPIDLDYTTGLMDLSVTPVPFSGIFRIFQVTSSFKSGVFKQVLYFTRMNADPDISVDYRSPIKEVTNPSKAKLQDAAPPTVNPKTNATGVVVSELENTVPIPANITAPKYAGFAPATPGAPANPITAANMSLAEIKNLSANLQATLANPLAGLQAEIASAQASLQGAVAGAAAQLTGAITNPINELKSSVNSVQVAANATVNQIKSPLSSIMRT